MYSCPILAEEVSQDRHLVFLNGHIHDLHILGDYKHVYNRDHGLRGRSHRNHHCRDNPARIHNRDCRDLRNLDCDRQRRPDLAPLR